MNNSLICKMFSLNLFCIIVIFLYQKYLVSVKFDIPHMMRFFIVQLNLYFKNRSQILFPKHSFIFRLVSIAQVLLES